MENTDQQSIPLDQVPLGVLGEFDACIQFLSDLPTARAMKEMGKTRVPELVRKIVETMALRKDDLIYSLRLMHLRENLLHKRLDAYRVMSVADKAIADFIEKNPDYDINIVAK